MHLKDFFEYVNQGDTQHVARVLRHAPQFVDRLMENNETPLLVAAAKVYVGIVKSLCDHGANTTLRNKANETPLIVAARNNSFEMVRIILRHNPSNLDDKDANGDTALIHATKNANFEMVREILKYQPNTNISNNNGDDAWETACESIPDKSSQPIIRSLIDNFTHVYIAHDWCMDQPGYFEDMERIERVNSALRRYGLKTWYPPEQLRKGGDIHVSIKIGLQNTCCILFMLTKRFRMKVNKTIVSKRLSLDSYPITDLGFFEYKKIQELYGSSSSQPSNNSNNHNHQHQHPPISEHAMVKEKMMIPMTLDSTTRYFKDGSKDGEMGNFLYGNPLFFDFNEFNFIDPEPERIPSIDSADDLDHSFDSLDDEPNGRGRSASPSRSGSPNRMTRQQSAMGTSNNNASAPGTAENNNNNNGSNSQVAEGKRKKSPAKGRRAEEKEKKNGNEPPNFDGMHFDQKIEMLREVIHNVIFR